MHRHHHEEYSRPRVPDAPLRGTPTLRAAINEAVGHARSALADGRLLTSEDAVCLAGPEARARETLYSIARSVAWSWGEDVDLVLRGLTDQFPSFE